MEKTKVLAVDDNEDVLMFYRRWGKSMGFEVVTVEDGRKAVEETKKGKFDLVFLDVQMPGMNGPETMKEIQKVAPSLPVFITTGSERDVVVEKAIKDGAAGYIYKPFDVEELADAVHKAMAASDAPR
jgi:two-component system, NtrC family, response regulator HydG